MIAPTPYMPEEVVPQSEVLAWKERLRQMQPKTDCPEEVQQFISAIAEKLCDFGQIRKYTTMIPGDELLLTGVKEVNGERVFSFASYPVLVPHMIAVDNYSSILRIYRRKGKKGLIDYCKAKVKDTELERVLDILNVHGFHIDRPEFIATMTRIEEAKKLEFELLQ